MADVRVRFAPAPTGPLHLGSAMAAVANYLFARRARGTFVLRVDDTDAERSHRRFERVIHQDAEWLGLRFEEGPGIGGEHGPYRQSERQELYAEAVRQLLEQGKAYRCFCSEADLEAQRREAEQARRPPRYDGRCSTLDAAEAARRAGSGEPFVVRLRVPTGAVVIPDAARGDIDVPSGSIGDFVILRSNGIATYNLATAYDDATMRITHVIRGEDHISNTASQLLVARALGLKEPRYGHYGLLLDEDGHKLAKSRGAESIADFKNEGYPPEAIVNYVALLVCPPLDGVDEVASLGALAARFSLSSLSAGQARFDRAKLDWLSQEHLKRLNPLDLASRVGRALEQRGQGYHPSQLTALAEALRGAHTITEAADEAQQVIARRPLDVPLDGNAANVLALFREVRAGWPETFLSHVEASELLDELRTVAAEQNIASRDVMRTLRLALTGAEHGVPMPYVIAAIERDDALARSGAPIPTA